MSNTTSPSPPARPLQDKAAQDLASEALIASMLAEEAYYLNGGPSRPPKATGSTAYYSDEGDDDDYESASKLRTKSTGKRPPATTTNDYGRKRQARESGPSTSQLSSTNLPSHGTRWKPFEDELLGQGIQQFGEGNWRAISDFIGSRNPLQVKNRARHLTLYKQPKAESAGSTAVNTLAGAPYQLSIAASTAADSPTLSVTSGPPSRPADLVTANPDDESDVDVISEDDSASAPRDLSNNMSPTVKMAVLASYAAVNPGASTLSSRSGVSSSAVSSVSPHFSEAVLAAAPVASPSPPQSPKDTTTTTTLSHVGSAATSSDSLPANLTTISDQERRAFPEFFRGKPSKTPARYLAIRNHILQAWYACQPQYLTKTRVRPALRGFGDVNVIGRIHAYLERRGDINQGAIMSAVLIGKRQAAKLSAGAGPVAMTTPRRKSGPRRSPLPVDSPASSPPRGNGSGQEDTVGNEVRPVSLSPSPPSRQTRPRRKNSAKAAVSDTEAYNPFTLVPLAPPLPPAAGGLGITVSSRSLVIMDFHAHLAETEIIGLLGGTFDADHSRVTVSEAFPCNSTSTGFQCEMDPVSEMEARDHFAARGLIVVGWYHSHPTFDPDPSIRDLENQGTYQELFRQVSGAEPFVGAIVCPFHPQRVSGISEIRFFALGHLRDATHGQRLPHVCSTSTTIPARGVGVDRSGDADGNTQAVETEAAAIYEQVVSLVELYRHHPHRTDLTAPYPAAVPAYSRRHQSSRLTKLLTSLRAHLQWSEARANQFIFQVRQLVVSMFGLTDTWGEGHIPVADSLGSVTGPAAVKVRKGEDESLDNLSIDSPPGSDQPVEPSEVQAEEEEEIEVDADSMDDIVDI
ncbi:hypothetical protein IWQ60_009119 [Tieghemiomyces parasiticus]|uniref:Myb-like, SWIRM and MPN domain-containing protein 1 n=1 Tax=Tieghemiomyces parasiticus TaxID=78921 RepID=A0A9W7ZP98_9FUNG|nr:hypothetical protein IWQ60_009119 [Tieghemiomyces parasiticus]